MTVFAHGFAFDPSYGYALDELLAVGSPQIPADFAAFWQARYARSMQVHPCPRIRHTGTAQAGYEVYSLRYFSTDHVVIRGWVLIPQDQPVTQGIVFGHGYGGCDGPDYRLHPAGTALLFPCFRGLARSQHPPVSSNPAFHVLHDIDKPQQYIIGGCVDDLWLAVSSMQMLFPVTKERSGQCNANITAGTAPGWGA